MATTEPVNDCAENIGDILNRLKELLMNGWELSYDDGYYIMSKVSVSLSHNEIENLINLTFMDMQGED